MNTLHHSEMGQRHLSTTWTLLRPRGQWYVSEIRHYDHDGEVVVMPQRAVKHTSLESALYGRGRRIHLSLALHRSYPFSIQ